MEGPIEHEAKQNAVGTGCGFVNKTANGTDDIWRTLEGQVYPRLWWEPGQGDAAE